MKKIIIAISSLCLFIAGCKKDPLSLTPDGRVTLTDVFNDNDQTGAYLNSCYTYMQRFGTNYFFFGMLAGYSDEAHDCDDPTENLPATAWYNGALTPSANPLEGPSGWSTNYYGQALFGIRKSNVFLQNIDKANVRNPSERARWKAEAKVIRAYYYWELIRMYGPMPIESVPYPVTFDYSKLTRSTFDSCVQFIANDCTEAIAEPQLPWRITSGDNDRGRFTKAVAYAIRSEALLFNASPLWNKENNKTKWQAAATATKEAIDALTAHTYGLANDYGGLFTSIPDVSSSNPSDNETILEIKNSDLSLMFFVHGIPATANFKAGDAPSQELVDSYEMKNGEMPVLGYNDADHLQPIINAASGYSETNPYVNRDPRFYATVFYNGAYHSDINGQPHNVESYVGGSDGIRNNDRHYTHNGYYLHKFVDPNLRPGQASTERWRKYRMGELYLNLAEAENEANGPTQIAQTAVNTLRARPSVQMPVYPSTLTQDEFRIKIRNERRVELAYEENRFFDVRRWKILDKTDKLTTGMQWTKNGNGTFTGKRIVVDRRASWADKFLLFPIPVNEMAALPSFEQNPNW